MAVPTYRELAQQHPGRGRGELACIRAKVMADEAEQQLQRLRARRDQEIARGERDPDGLVNAEWLVRSIWAEALRPRTPEFEQRSFLRRREQAFRACPLHDGHVRLHASIPPTDLAAWTCVACGGQMRHMDRHRSKGGYLTAHCGCREGKKGRDKNPDWRARRNELKRAQRQAAKPHDAHVEEWRRKPKAKIVLHDAHVRAMRSDSAAYARWRTATDPAYRLNQRMRVQVRKALRGGKAGRSWESFLGYTLQQLVSHLSRMLPRMVTLQQALADGWHIDHITPKSLFDCAIPSELKRAWCLSNLRLIPATDNLRKNARVEFLL